MIAWTIRSENQHNLVGVVQNFSTRMNKMEEEDDNSGDIVDPKVVQWVKREKHVETFCSRG